MKKSRKTSEPENTSAIRHQYEQFGVEHYYQSHAESYANPHYPQIAALVQQNLHRIDHTGLILDFCAGAGEVTTALQASGVEAVVGSDPFTADLYRRQTGKPCHEWSFQDIIKMGLSTEFSSIICSFALHLCPEKDLFPVTWPLLSASPHLIIITPHKRPALETLPGIQLSWEDAVLTERGKQVRMRAFQKV